MVADPHGQRGTSIDIDGVTMVFNPETNPFQALLEISLHVTPGEFVSVVGPSGCGKSTLMLLTAGLLRPTTGEIRVADKRLESPLTDVGIVFQDDLLLEFRTAQSNILLQGQVRKLDKDRVKTRTGELMEQLGVAHAADRYPKQLSGGHAPAGRHRQGARSRPLDPVDGRAVRRARRADAPAGAP